MLVQGDERAKGMRLQSSGEDEGRRPIARHHLVWHQLLGRAICAHLFGRSAEGQHSRLSERIGGEHVLHVEYWLQGLREEDEVAGHDLCSLMEQLVERVLAIRPGLAPVNRPRVVVHRRAIDPHRFAVALHGELLQIGGEARQELGVGKHRVGGDVEEIPVPDRDHAHPQREVRLRSRTEEVLIHGVEAVEQLPESPGADGDHRAQADGRVHRVPTAHPVPEAEHVGDVDAEGGDSLGVRRYRHEVLLHGTLAQCIDDPVSRGLGIREGLLRAERLGSDDEERLGGIEAAQGLGDVCRVDVGHEAEGHVPVGVEPQGLICHRRTKV